jgi:ubiquinol-cytochrome c reductase cytochrome c1 subunit
MTKSMIRFCIARICALLFALALTAVAPVMAEEAASAVPAVTAAEAVEAVEWESWRANNDTSNLSSLQQGARNYMNYCIGCHSLKYLRYSRMASDLKISTEQLQQYLMPIDAKPADYITTSLVATDGSAWFGKEPPDLSLIARARSVDYLYRFLKTFYTDTSRTTLTNNLALENAAMPAVLSDLGGVQEAVYTNVTHVVDGKPVVAKVFSHFELTTPGRLTPDQFNSFVRDTVNFLDYAGEPAQVDRRSIGLWVVLFLLVLTWLAWLLKKEYWKNVH